VEVVSGESFGDYLRDHVLEPAGMASTTSTVTDDEPVPGLADGHVVAYGRAVAADGMGTFTVRVGGLVSSAADMARWLIVHANGGQAADGSRVVSGRAMQVLHTPSAPKTGYALGWDTDGPTEAPTRLEHSGSVLTYSAEHSLWPKSGYGVVLLFNSGSAMLLDQLPILHGVFDIVEGRQPPSAGRPLALTLDAVLALLTVTALALGTCGALRADRWARRWRGAPGRMALGLLPSPVVLGAGTAFSRLAELWFGRDVTWRAAAYGWPALVVFVTASLVAAAVTLAARSWSLFGKDASMAQDSSRQVWWPGQVVNSADRTGHRRLRIDGAGPACVDAHHPRRYRQGVGLGMFEPEAVSWMAWDGRRTRARRASTPDAEAARHDGASPTRRFAAMVKQEVALSVPEPTRPGVAVEDCQPHLLPTLLGESGVHVSNALCADPAAVLPAVPEEQSDPRVRLVRVRDELGCHRHRLLIEEVEVNASTGARQLAAQERPGVVGREGPVVARAHRRGGSTPGSSFGAAARRTRPCGRLDD
jgi:hypothetical protein